MKSARLGDVALIERRSVDPSKIDPNTCYIGLEHLERGGRIIGHDTVGKAELASSKFTFSDRHLLYGKLRPNLGKISRPTFDGVCSTDILPVLPGPRLDRNYLAHYLAQPSMVDFAASRATGANLPRLSPSTLEEFDIPLPPLEEQRRIAAILDRADALRAKRRDVLAHLDALVGAVFEATFRTESPSKPIGAVGRVTTGRTPPTAVEGMFDGPVPFVTPGDLGSSRAVARSLTHEGASASRLVRPGATLVCCIGATIGKVGVATVESAFNQQINAIEWDTNIIDDAYGLEVMRLLKPVIVSGGASTTMPLLPKGRFVKLEIPVPALEDQRRFSARVSRVGGHRTRVQRALESDNQLIASLQSRAFRGEL